MTAPGSTLARERSDPRTVVAVGEEKQALRMAVLVRGSQQPENKLWF